MIGGIFISYSPVARAWARRLSGEVGSSARGEAEVEALKEEVAELRRGLEDVHNRLDFTERMLAQARERGVLGPPKER